MSTGDEIAESLRTLMLTAMTFGTVQQFEFMRTAEPLEDEDDFGSLVPEPAPRPPSAGHGRISLPEPGRD